MTLESTLPTSFQETSFLIWMVVKGEVSRVVCKL